MAKVLDELLATPDPVNGSKSPLAADLVQKFYSNGKVASAEDIGRFLSRHASEARTVGQKGGLFATGRPQDVLQAIGPKTFGDRPDHLGRPNGFAPNPIAQVAPVDPSFGQGASSATARAADKAAFDRFHGGGGGGPAQPQAGHGASGRPCGRDGNAGAGRLAGGQPRNGAGRACRPSRAGGRYDDFSGRVVPPSTGR